MDDVGFIGFCSAGDVFGEEETIVVVIANRRKRGLHFFIDNPRSSFL
jgi:hypothetical protein